MNVKSWPALDVHCGEPADLLLAALDDFGPTAIEEHATGIRVFFPTAQRRDAARLDLTNGPLAGTIRVDAIDVPDDDWARRSQQDLAPIAVGRIVVAPPWSATGHQAPATGDRPALTIVIAPSMGFGTGHHATTRLCLDALQRIDLSDRRVLDVGTGSGVLAIAAAALGAAAAKGIDNDADAIQSATENLALNGDLASHGVTFDLADLASARLTPADVVVANLTGAFLVRASSRLRDLVAPNGSLILSGILADERHQIVRAFADLSLAWEREEDGWVGLLMKRS